MILIKLFGILSFIFATSYVSTRLASDWWWLSLTERLWYGTLATAYLTAGVIFSLLVL